jgi:hypothetical protein
MADFSCFDLWDWVAEYKDLAEKVCKDCSMAIPDKEPLYFETIKENQGS